MNTKQAKEKISINEYLQSNGYQPVKQNNNSLWYLSPFRNEKTASFVVNEIKGIFTDWGTGEKGTIIDLVMQLHHTDISGALEILSRHKPSPENLPILSFKKQNISVHTKSFPGKIDKIENSRIKLYLKKRGIDKQVWERCNFLFQYAYPNPKSPDQNAWLFYNLAWKNDSGGYELSNNNFKRCIFRKDITTISGSKNELNIFEGFFDFLSALIFYKAKKLNGTTIVLNSVVLLDKIMPVLKDYVTINAYLDNDKAGETALKVIEETGKRVNNKSKEIYPDFKDFNEFLVNTVSQSCKHTVNKYINKQ